MTPNESGWTLASLSLYHPAMLADRLRHQWMGIFFLPEYNIYEWNTLYTDASSVNLFKNRLDTYLVKAGYTYNTRPIYIYIYMNSQ